MDDESTEFDPNDPGNIEVARRLEVYADARLTPSAAATARARTAVMSAAHRQAALRDASVATSTASATPAASPAAAGLAASPRPHLFRRAFVAVAAIALVVAVVLGATKGTDPGGLFYPTRIGIEAANLPADLGARASAQIARLAERVGEARQSTTAGDGTAVRAALTAYVQILLATEAGAHGDPRATTVIIVNVTRYVADFDDLTPHVPSLASTALADARTTSLMVLTHLNEAK